jgi:hypothetical protein
MKRKLSLNRETLATLSPADLLSILGGDELIPPTNGHPQSGCSLCGTTPPKPPPV